MGELLKPKSPAVPDVKAQEAKAADAREKAMRAAATEAQGLGLNLLRLPRSNGTGTNP